MQISTVFTALSSLAAGLVPARSARPLEIEGLGPEPLDPFEHAAIGTWITDDGAIRLDLKPDGRFDKRKAEMPGTHRGRYAVDRMTLYFEGDSGWTGLGAMRRGGLLSIGEKRFRKA
jgi:hypothetical protein